MKRAICLLFLLVLAPSASAKEITAAELCGRDACVPGGAALKRSLEVGGDPVDAPTRAAPFYAIRAEMDGRSFTVTFVPELQLARGSDGTWMQAPAEMHMAFKRSGLESRPFQAKQLLGVVGGSPAPVQDRPMSAPRRDAASDDGGGIPALPLAAGVLLAAGAVAALRRRPRVA